MFSGIKSESFHNYFINVDWNLEKIKSYFGDSPTILRDVLHSRSCPADVVKLLLKQGADINCQDEIGYSPLMISLQNTNDKEVIRVLLEGGAEVNKVDGENRTPLLIYLERENCSVDIVKTLLDFEADVNHKNKDGYSPLMMAIRSKKDNIIQVLVEGGAEVNDLGNIHNSPLLLLLIQRKNCSLNSVKLLLANGADPNCVDNQGDSCLVWALRNFCGAEIIKALLEKGADANRVCKFGVPPLLLYLKDYYSDDCSFRMIKLLLYYKADVNCINTFGDSPLSTALRYRRPLQIVQILLENGARFNTLHCDYKSPLCIAFEHSSNDVVKLLLDAGSSPNTCAYHENPLHCALDFSRSGLREDILKKLLEENVDVNFVNEYGQSVVCFALEHGAQAKDIRLLLDAGASINTCTVHSSALLCATCRYSFWRSQPLREDVVQLLLDNGACVEGEDLIVLQYALTCEYETGAVQLLLELPGMDAYVASNELLLHHAVSHNCRIEVVKLLLSKNVQVFSKNSSGETALHRAARNERCDPRIIKLLLEHGCPVNAETENGETPFMYAVKIYFEHDILKALLLAGAQIGKTKFGCGFKRELPELLASEWEQSSYQKIMSSYEMLAKFYLLQNPEFDIKTFEHQTNCYYKNKLLIFLNDCLNELGKMNSLQISHGRTFDVFVRGDCLSPNTNGDQILMYLTENAFPVFFDIISDRIGRSTMEAKVKKLQVYAHKTHSMEQINLNHDILHKISEYLVDEDLLKFILASYKPVDQNDSGGASKDNSLLGKRSCKPSTEHAKCPKLQR